MIKPFFCFLFLVTPKIENIYHFQIPAADKTVIKLSNYKHKKMLIVNTASNSNQAYQLAALQQLYTQYMDSLVVIAFPSNSFGNEPLNDSAIVALMHQTYSITFPIAAKSEIKGNTTNPMYRWLANKILNDVVNVKINTDFQKYLIDGNGRLVGQFDSSISPLSDVVQDALHKFK